MTGNDLEFTRNGYDIIEETITDADFYNYDAEKIFDCIIKTLRIPFSAHLIRYMYNIYGMKDYFPGQDAMQIPVKEYRKLLVSAFRETNTCLSFDGDAGNLTQTINRWLPKDGEKVVTPSRNRVLLIGFALQMNAYSVEKLLQDGLQEDGINVKDPHEVICWYCYENQLPFAKYKILYDKYLACEADEDTYKRMYLQHTAGVRSAMHLIKGEDDLMDYLAALKTPGNEPKVSATKQRYLQLLYRKAREETARCLQLRHNSNPDNVKYREYKPEDISPADIEHILASAVPLDRHGNQVKFEECMLHDQFANCKMSKQRLDTIIKDPTKEITRQDLITLHFYGYAMELQNNVELDNSEKTYLSEYEVPEKQFHTFQESMNTILSDCGFGKMYYANPYEAFILMCVASVSPLDTYADVMERAYE